MYITPIILFTNLRLLVAVDVLSRECKLYAQVQQVGEAKQKGQYLHFIMI